MRYATINKKYFVDFGKPRSGNVQFSIINYESASFFVKIFDENKKNVTTLIDNVFLYKRCSTPLLFSFQNLIGE